MANKLEDIINLVAEDAESEWFRNRGRTIRNSVAHGRWSEEGEKSDVESLLTTVRQVVVALIRFRVEEDRSALPIKSFLAHLETKANR